MVTIKSNRELEIMRQCGKRVAQVLMHVTGLVRPGVSLAELDREAEQMALNLGTVPAFKGYLGYKHSLCTSVNEQVVHGIPTARKLKDGDIVGFDFGLIFEGFYGDSAVTVPVGEVSEEAKQLMKATRDSLYAGIRMSRAGNTLRDVARAIEETVMPFQYGIVREFVGHGIGQKLHEEPQVPNYEAGASNLKLRSGMTIAIEPMVNIGTAAVRVLEDRWTAVTVDGKLSAHFEHTIAITDGDPEILTEWSERPFGELPKSGLAP